MCIIAAMKYYGYDDFKNDTNILLKKISDFKPEAVVGIARGGLTLSHAIAEGLDIRDVQTIKTEHYDKTKKLDTLTLSGKCNFKHQRKVLVVDDISDSGDTLKAVMEYFTSEFKDIEFRTCTLFYKKTSIYEPTYWVNDADEWIDFFWESDFKVN